MKRLMSLTGVFCLLYCTVLCMTGCFTDPDNATRVLRQSGYTNIQLTGYSVWGCSKDDQYSTGFKATSPGGDQVSGAVCREFFSGSHIRLN